MAETISEGAICDAPSIGTARHTTATAANVATKTVWFVKVMRHVKQIHENGVE